MNSIKLLFVISMLVFATGCPKYRPNVDFKNPDSFVSKLNAYITTRQAAYVTALGSVPDGPAKAKVIRNELIEDVVPYVDGAYIDFITDLQAGRDRTNFVADLVELGTSAAVGITKGERPLQILGVALTAFRGGRRSADLNFYREQTTPVLITKMDGNRAKVRATILTREKDSVADYPIGAAISDIVDYYNAGTLVRAFTELSKDTALETRSSEDKLLKVKVPTTPEATQEIRNLSVAATKIIQELARELRDAATRDAATKRLQSIVATLEKDTDLAPIVKNANISSKDTDGANLRTRLIEIRRSLALVNNNNLLNKLNQAIVDSEPAESPSPSPSPSPSASPTPSPSPSPSPSASPAATASPSPVVLTK
ncbi:MAG TPA: hypothetical protein VJ875_22285 [Pyrinomonadaceae bacterium]|nr:hypothetical protein [Pyrinomonadaceae bacterium]